MVKKILLICAVLLLVGCEKPAIRQVTTNNPKFDVQELFEKDGCKVYRFHDSGDRLYFVRCGTQAEISWRQTRTSGKVVYSVPRIVQTVEIP